MAVTPFIRRLHRAVAIGSVVFLSSTAVTGLLWAYAPFLYWEEGYMKKKRPTPSPALAEASVTIQEAIGVAQGGVGRPIVVDAVILRPDFGRLLYEVHYREAGSAGVFLVDAISGEPLSPLAEAHAVEIAKQYVRDASGIERIDRLDAFVPRSGGAGVPAYRIRFRAPRSPEIVIHRDSGQILEDQDAVRRFHFFVMRLHQFNVLGFRKTLTVLSGLPLLVLITTGVWLWAVPSIRGRRGPGKSGSSAQGGGLVSPASERVALDADRRGSLRRW